MSPRLFAIAGQRLIITILLILIRRRRIRRRTARRRRSYVRYILRNRQQYGEFHTLTAQQRLYDHQSYRDTFRMTPTQMQKLLEKVGGRLLHERTHRNPICPSERLAVTLKFLATGIEQKPIANNFRMGRATVMVIINETCKAIWDILNGEVLQVPKQEQWVSISDHFYNRWNFPHCLGALDGKHIVIQAPIFSGSLFYNYKSQHSIVLLAACDANYKFTLVDIGAPGSNSDGGIFAKSPMGKAMEANSLNLPPPAIVDGYELPYAFVGDEAFPLKLNLMRPFPRKYVKAARSDEDFARAIYNYRLCRARRLIENTFGIWSIQWRIFKRPIIGNVENIEQYVKATICLHNWLRQCDNNTVDELVDKELPDGSVQDGNWRAQAKELGICGLRNIGRTGSNMYKKEAADIRSRFVEYFSSPQGSVTWQTQHVLRGNAPDK